MKPRPTHLAQSVLAALLIAGAPAAALSVTLTSSAALADEHFDRDREHKGAVEELDLAMKATDKGEFIKHAGRAGDHTWALHKASPDDASFKALGLVAEALLYAGRGELDVAKAKLGEVKPFLEQHQKAK